METKERNGVFGAVSAIALLSFAPIQNDIFTDIGNWFSGLSQVGTTLMNPTWWIMGVILPIVLIAVGMVMLTGKLALLGRFLSLIVGLVSIGLGVYLLMNGGQLPFI